MTPPVWPCAVVPSNHILVQELLLHASLGRRRCSLKDGSDYFDLAKLTACFERSCRHLVFGSAFPRGLSSSPWSNVVTRQILFSRILHQCTSCYEHIMDDDNCGSEKKLRAHVFYDDAIIHQNSINRQLWQHGYRISLVGSFRCGSPVAPQVDFLMTYKPCATDLEPDKGGMKSASELLFGRVIQGLQASGYIKHSTRETKRDIYTKKCIFLTNTPMVNPQPFSTSTAGTQALSITWSPPQQFPTRQLFLTGPRPFVSHLTLLAHAKGLDLRPSGLYNQRLSPTEPIALECEKDVFMALQLPYVEPFYRHAYCRLHKLR